MIRLGPMGPILLLSVMCNCCNCFLFGNKVGARCLICLDLLCFSPYLMSPSPILGQCKLSAFNYCRHYVSSMCGLLLYLPTAQVTFTIRFSYHKAVIPKQCKESRVIEEYRKIFQTLTNSTSPLAMLCNE